MYTNSSLGIAQVKSVDTVSFEDLRTRQPPDAADRHLNVLAQQAAAKPDVHDGVFPCIVLLATDHTTERSHGFMITEIYRPPVIRKKDSFPAFFRELSRPDYYDEFVRLSKLSHTKHSMKDLEWRSADARYPRTRSLPQSDRETALRTLTSQLRSRKQELVRRDVLTNLLYC